ncbi:hypothetical protein DPEC_G00010720 [Dallia pectoralis]|uniref:Uncharacterized protein n=1 Tax=Dallia pectoralis TaxID=75939 RepID=A0ACC2HM41_DALPE|nr:hypothetical protein DPEC_G00010720 [Dallia pectoralis]
MQSPYTQPGLTSKPPDVVCGGVCHYGPRHQCCSELQPYVGTSGSLFGPGFLPGLSAVCCPVGIWCERILVKGPVPGSVPGRSHGTSLSYWLVVAAHRSVPGSVDQHTIGPPPSHPRPGILTATPGPRRGTLL